MLSVVMSVHPAGQPGRGGVPARRAAMFEAALTSPPRPGTTS